MASIVIIEEDDLMRELLKEWLGAAGHAVRERALRATPVAERADLVIVDVYMPRKVGADMVHAAQRAHRGAPVIAISGQFRPGLGRSRAAAQALGAQHIIPKPFSREELLAAVRLVIGPA